MTPQEFKAWFEGFTEAFTGVPTKAQWARIKERVGEIDGKPVTERVYIDRYLPQYIPGYPRPYWAAYGVIGASTTMLAAGSNLNAAASQYQGANALNTAFNSTEAMTALGRADAQALNS
jgi:hypothetical protein